MLRIGIIGLGFMAATHLKAYRQVKGVQIAGLCNPSGKHLDGDFTNVAGNVGNNEPFKMEMAGVTATKDFAELLKCDVDAIDICAPTHTHHELAIAALRAGKHVICEKPMARNSTLAREMIRVSQETGKNLMPAMCLRFWPGWRWLKETIDAGTYGKVYSARFRRLAEPPAWGQHNFLNAERSGGALLDLHIHDTDFVNYCFGVPQSVFSTGYKKISNAIDHVVTQYQVKSGAIVHAEGSWAMAKGWGFNMSYTVNFEKATADYDIARTADPLRLYEEGKPIQVMPCDGPDGYTHELQYFAELVSGKIKPSIVTSNDGLAALNVCEAEERSIVSGKPEPVYAA